MIIQVKKLGLQEYINRLPKSLLTEITQDNFGVSGGQAQVIAFIRSILSKKDILILYEPISNVDTETKDIILNILKEFDFEGILIIISHVLQGLNYIVMIEWSNYNKVIKRYYIVVLTCIKCKYKDKYAYPKIKNINYSCIINNYFNYNYIKHN